MKRIENAEMSEYTSFKAGGKADLLLIPDTEEELAEALSIAGEREAGVMILGNGSDTLVKDGGFRGTVIKLGEGFSSISVDGEKLIAGSAALLSQAAKVALENSLTGLECESGIPGSVGGAVFMNAGAYGGEIKDVIESVTYVSRQTGEIKEYQADELDLSYRHSIFTETGDIILKAVFGLKKGDHDEIEAKMKDLTEQRNSKQPLNYPSAGSFFKRPEGHFAGKLIQDAGLKGLAVGGAMVSEKHSGFIINTGGATATDIISLMHLVQNTVFDRFGVKLEPEVRIVGED